jgi:hypothetical protein
MLNNTGAEMLKPLLMNLPFIETVKIADSFPSCHYDFDRMRKIGLRYTGSISRWYFYAFPELTTDLHPPLKFSITPTKTTPIVLNRSERYHNPTFDYRILAPYMNMITFVGLETEYNILKRKLPGMVYHPVKDFAEMASIVLGSRVFIGNQSMAYSIAEIAGHNRILEVCPYAHNCIPMTPNGKDCANLQNLFEHIKLQFPKHEQMIKERASMATDEHL